MSRFDYRHYLPNNHCINKYISVSKELKSGMCVCVSIQICRIKKKTSISILFPWQLSPANINLMEHG